MRSELDRLQKLLSEKEDAQRALSSENEALRKEQEKVQVAGLKK